VRDPPPVRRLPHQAVLDEDRQQLLDEERHPGRGLEHPLPRVLREAGAADQRLDEERRVRLR
jgi:hypothetical protein